MLTQPHGKQTEKHGALSGVNRESQESATSDPPRIIAPTITLPKGGGAIRGIGEKFAANPVTGTGSMTLPIAVSPGRSGFGPQLSLSYDSGSGNGPFGFGWSLSLPSITRKTDKGLPQYRDAEESDVFILSGAEDLVPVLEKQDNDWIRKKPSDRLMNDKTYRVQPYRPRIEGLFARIERWMNQDDHQDTFWRSISKDNITTWYGKTAESRIADPADPSHIFSWLICQSYDDKGNAIVYKYVQENDEKVEYGQANERNRVRTANRYPKRIKYGNRKPNRDASWNATDPALLTQPTDWMFEILFDYGEGHYKEQPPDADKRMFANATLAPPANGHWPARLDRFSTYRAGYEVRTYRLCRRVLMFRQFPQELETPDYLVRATEFTYAESPIASFITSVTQSGYVHRPIAGQPNRYLKKSLPPLEFEYSLATIQDEIREIDPESLENLPYGLDGSNYQWVDLDGEGISGILTEQADGWFYKRNLSPNHQVLDNGVERTVPRFGPVELVGAKPAASIAAGQNQFLDLAGDGQLDLVQFDGPMRGFYERTEDQGWEGFRPFVSWPNLNTRDPNVKFVDLTGDGHADILITEHDAFLWHQSFAEDGFAQAERVAKLLDEEKGPALVFADGTQSIYLAGFSGDGLTDLVRIRNGEVCYWPNLGYGRFGAKVTMDNAPWFDAPDQFDQRRIRLADIDGSGVTDILYLGRDGVHVYFNQSGNAWADAQTIVLPKVDNIAAVQAVDLLGNGTACLVWSSPLAGDARRPMRYIDLMGGQKPHLLIVTKNNLGAETHVRYAPSTKFYLDDDQDGRPWITRLPFPVHVVERVETYDRISRNRFVTRYKYHHGYFDGEEREFRGFGMVEQFDTEEIGTIEQADVDSTDTNLDEASFVSPVRTKTWFHTGVYVGREHVSDFFAGLLDANDKGEYYREPDLNDEQARKLLLDDTVLPDGLTVEEEREACRSLKGMMLRQEVYADDALLGSSEAMIQRARTPYTVLEQNFTIRTLQPRAGNRHGVFFTHAREAITYHYERNPADRRSSHAMTLDVDKYGNVLKSVAIGYDRKRGQSPLDGDDKNKQEQVLITYTENDVNKGIDKPVNDPGYDPDNHRTPLPCEARTYELTGLTPENGTQHFTFEELTRNNFDKILNLTEVPYQQAVDYSARRKRLIERVRTLYRKDDLTALSPLSEVGVLALPGETYKLAFTPGLLAQVYKRRLGAGPEESLLPNPAQVLGGRDSNRGGYVDLDGNGHWWMPSGKIFYDPTADADNPAATAVAELTEARKHFFLPRKFTDPFGHSTIVNYDLNDLLVIKTEDPAENVVEAVNDYRVLQPTLVTDPNGAVSEVRFDALGLVVGTAVYKGNEGDSFKTFEVDLTQEQVDTFFTDPKGLAVAWLGTATTRIIYDLDRSTRLGEPPFAATLARETHVSELQQNQQTKLQVSFSYSDGFGREIQKKIQAEPEPPTVSPRWVGSGWTIFNNKGKPVRKYEPFFTTKHDFEFEKQIGVSVTLFYDPLERVVATLYPNHTYEKVVFDPWQQTTHDVNDTVTLDPRSDEDVKGFFVNPDGIPRLPEPDYLPTWYALRTDPTHAAEAAQRWPDPAIRDAETKAAEKAKAHEKTPPIAHLDTLGRTFLTIVDNGPDPAQPGKHLLFATRVVLDIEGNQREVIDAKDRVVMRYGYDMLGTRIHQTSMEAGERWMLNDVTGKPIRAWDSRGFMRRMAYDKLRRPTELYVTDNVVERLTENTVYGEGQGNAKNHRARVYQVFDGAGVVTSEEYDFKGNVRSSSREVAQDYKNPIDWNAPPQPGEKFTSSTTYDALNRPKTVTMPDKSVYRPTFNEANLLDKVEVNLRGAAATTPLVTNINYNAKEQRELIAYGNGAQTNYEYDPLTFRLTRLRTTRPAGMNGLASKLFTDPAVVQDLRYTYDPSGNITHIADASLKTIFHNNEQVEPVCQYTYDAIYRLIEAKGREHIGQVSKPETTWNDKFRVNLPHPEDGQKMCPYNERYEYDAVGNIGAVRHVTPPFGPHGDGSWTRAYTYDEPSQIEPTKASNRLTSTTVGTTTETYTHDVHGNMVSMPHLSQIAWDFKDQLQQVDLGGGGTAFYVYDATGQRVRKMVERQSGAITKEERIYLGGFEVFRQYNSNGLKLERETLHIMDDKQRIALVETKTVDTQNPALSSQDLTRYQLSNHLGSASLELDDQAQVISYDEYYPYGSTSYQAVRSQTETPKRYRYTGKERDEESGLYYHGARYYAPWLGRWTSCDPAGIVDGPNPYAYVKDNPAGLVDPKGKKGKRAFEIDTVDYGLRGTATVYGSPGWASVRRDEQKQQLPLRPQGPWSGRNAIGTTSDIHSGRIQRDLVKDRESIEGLSKQIDELGAKEQEFLSRSQEYKAEAEHLRHEGLIMLGDLGFDVLSLLPIGKIPKVGELIKALLPGSAWLYRIHTHYLGKHEAGAFANDPSRILNEPSIEFVAETAEALFETFGKHNLAHGALGFSIVAIERKAITLPQEIASKRREAKQYERRAEDALVIAHYAHAQQQVLIERRNALLHENPQLARELGEPWNSITKEFISRQNQEAELRRNEDARFMHEFRWSNQ
jgi:RHS repeat-associated protein